MESPVCRWGIMGCANIARKNARCMLLAENASVVAVASRNKDKATQWIADHHLLAGGTEAVEGYDALLARDDVDAVYIPLPTALHLEWVVKTAQAGKHILCEKPVALNAEELSTMLAACEAANVQFMDGVMFMHHARMQKMDAFLRGDPYNDFGEVQRVTSGFSFMGNEDFFKSNIRASSSGDPLGCLGDLGWYCVRFGLFAFGWDNKPLAVSAKKLKDASEVGAGEGVPIDMTVEVYFNEAHTRMLSFHCSFCHPFRQWIEVVGTGKTLSLKDFVLAKAPSSCEFTVEHNAGLIDYDCLVSTTTETVTTIDCCQELEMIKTFSDIVLTKKVDPFWPDVSLTTQKVLDAAMASAAQGGTVVEV